MSIESDGGNVVNDGSNIGGDGGESTSGNAVGGNDKRKRSPVARLVRPAWTFERPEDERPESLGAIPGSTPSEGSGNAETGDSGNVDGGSIAIDAGGGNVNSSESSERTVVFC